MSNKNCIFLIVPIIIFFYSTSPAQLTDNNAIQVKILYEALEFDKAISTGQELVKTNLEFNKDELSIIHQFVALSFYNMGKIDSARSHFLSLLSINPGFELDPIKVSPKIISFFNQLKEETQSVPADNTIGYTKYVFMEDLRPGATLRSFILPGWGQLYKHQKRRGYIIGGAFVASLAATVVSLYLEKTNHDKYLESTTPSTIEENYQTYNDWFKRRKLLTISTISIWAVAILDALWSPYPHGGISIDNNNLSFSVNIPLGK